MAQNTLGLTDYDWESKALACACFVCYHGSQGLQSYTSLLSVTVTEILAIQSRERFIQYSLAENFEEAKSY